MYKFTRKTDHTVIRFYGIKSDNFCSIFKTSVLLSVLADVTWGTVGRFGQLEYGDIVENL